MSDQVHKIIADTLALDISLIKPDSSFIDDLGADSLDHVEVVMAIEEEFGIEIPDDEAEKLTLVSDVVRYIQDNN